MNIDNIVYISLMLICATGLLIIVGFMIGAF